MEMGLADEVAIEYLEQVRGQDNLLILSNNLHAEVRLARTETKENVEEKIEEKVDEQNDKDKDDKKKEETRARRRKRRTWKRIIRRGPG